MNIRNITNFKFVKFSPYHKLTNFIIDKNEMENNVINQDVIKPTNMCIIKIEIEADKFVEDKSEENIGSTVVKLDKHETTRNKGDNKPKSIDVEEVIIDEHVLDLDSKLTQVKQRVFGLSRNLIDKS